MIGITLAAIATAMVFLSFVAWRQYLRIARSPADGATDTSPHSVTEIFGEAHLLNVPHQSGVRWLTDIFSRSVKRFPNHIALQVPHTGESLTYAELDHEANKVAAAVTRFLSGPDQVVAVAMTQDNWQTVACHLGILKAGGTVVFLDLELPDALLSHMLADAQPVVVLAGGQDCFRGLPTVDVLSLPDELPATDPPFWLDDPTQRLATIFYTSGTTGMPKGVECHHAGYVNLALTYADYFDLVAGVDATTLTSSLGYDGSISEMYSAWVSGCAVVLLTKEQVRSGPDLLPILCESEVTVFFCPPVLLTTLTPSPERDLPYPICRYIVPAGEAFASALVEPWTRARRQVINTYGPTEASTDTSRQSLRPGEPVTIGSPMANVTYVILEPGTLRPLPHGEIGELCIGGVHVARGYRNLPEQTAEKFISHPDFGRLYRTGDRCRIDPVKAQTHFLGRIDTQLKVRGHRVEIQAVEDILQTQIPEIETAVLDYQNEELIAFIAAPGLGPLGSSEVVPARPDWAKQVTKLLAKQLPPPSVPTRFFFGKNFVLNPRSGKIDRSQLPRIAAQSTDSRLCDLDTPDKPANANIVAQKMAEHGTDRRADPDDDEVLLICRSLLGPSLDWDDAFADHGAHSILIAQLAQRLRLAGWSIPVRALLSDCDTARTIASRPKQVQLPAPVAAAAHRQDSGRDEAAAKVLPVAEFTVRQVLLLLALYAPHLVGFLAIVAYGDVASFFLTTGYWEFLAVGFLLSITGLALPFANLLWVLVIKTCLPGMSFRQSEASGSYPKWSSMHLRIWCVGRLQHAVLRPISVLFRSPPLTAFVLRCLGATVGRHTECAHDIRFNGPLELLSIEDAVAIQSAAHIQMARWVGQELEIGPVKLEQDCKIGMHACVGNGGVVGEGAWVTPLTPVLGDIGPGEMWDGAPAQPVGRYTKLERSARYCKSILPMWLEEATNIIMQSLLDFVLLVAPATTVIWVARFIIPNSGVDPTSVYFMTAPIGEVAGKLTLYVFATTWVSILLSSVLACLFVRATRTSPGLYTSRGPEGALLLYRQRLMNQIQRFWTWTITGQYLRALAGIRFSRQGGSECDVMLNLIPETATADAKVFWANGCFTNMLDQDARQLILRQLDMPANFFAGNNCVAEDGHFPTNFLLGVSSPGNGIAFRRQMHSRLGQSITVAGNPPVRFSSADFEAEWRNQTLPNFSLFLGRIVLNDIFSIGFLRTTNVIVYVFVYTILLRIGGDYLLSALLALILTEFTLILACGMVKRLLVGRSWGTDHSTAFWSWRHFTYFFAQDCFFAWCKTPFRVTAGTVLPNPALRWLGCDVGARSLILSPLQAYDWNAVKIGDDAIVDGALQYHSLENMTLTVKRSRIGDGAVVNSGATVMGGAVIDAGATLLPLSLVLKEMSLPTGVYWGSPAELAELEEKCLDTNQSP